MKNINIYRVLIFGVDSSIIPPLRDWLVSKIQKRNIVFFEVHSISEFETLLWDDSRFSIVIYQDTQDEDDNEFLESSLLFFSDYAPFIRVSEIYNFVC